jgi:hypothetical protein
MDWKARQLAVQVTDAMVFVLQLQHFLAFVSKLCEPQPNLHGAVVHIFRESRAKNGVHIPSNFLNLVSVAHRGLRAQTDRTRDWPSDSDCRLREIGQINANASRVLPRIFVCMRTSFSRSTVQVNHI